MPNKNIEKILSYVEKKIITPPHLFLELLKNHAVTKFNFFQKKQHNQLIARLINLMEQKAEIKEIENVDEHRLQQALQLLNDNSISFDKNLLSLVSAFVTIFPEYLSSLTQIKHRLEIIDPWRVYFSNLAKKHLTLWQNTLSLFDKTWSCSILTALVPILSTKDKNQFITLLQHAFEDRESKMRMYAYRALDVLLENPSQDERITLYKSLQKALHSKDLGIRISTHRGMTIYAKTASDEEQAMIFRSFQTNGQDNEPNVKAAALRTIASFSSKKIPVRTILQKALKDENSVVKNTTKNELLKLNAIPLSTPQEYKKIAKKNPSMKKIRTYLNSPFIDIITDACQMISQIPERLSEKNKEYLLNELEKLLNEKDDYLREVTCKTLDKFMVNANQTQRFNLLRTLIISVNPYKESADMVKLMTHTYQINTSEKLIEEITREPRELVKIITQMAFT